MQNSQRVCHRQAHCYSAVDAFYYCAHAHGAHGVTWRALGHAHGVRSFIIMACMGQVFHHHIPTNLPHTSSLTCLPSYSAHQSGLPPQPLCGDPKDRQAPPHHLAHRCLRSPPARVQALVVALLEFRANLAFFQVLFASF